jgi:ketosteroid isomerase-like protein
MRAAAASRVEEPGAGGPELAVHAFAAALSTGNLSAATARFTRSACLLTPDGTEIHGREGIAAVLSQLISRRTQISIEQLVLREAGDVVLASALCTIRSDGPEGSRFVQTSAPTLVLQKVEGAWKIAVADPWSEHAQKGHLTLVPTARKASTRPSVN